MTNQIVLNKLQKFGYGQDESYSIYSVFVKKNFVGFFFVVVVIRTL